MDVWVVYFFSMALQPFGPLSLFQFLIPIYSRYDSLNGRSARSKAVTYTQNNTNIEQTHTNIHASSGIRTHNPSKLAKTVRGLGSAVTVICTDGNIEE
jgi:hypothetical protein